MPLSASMKISSEITKAIQAAAMTIAVLGIVHTGLTPWFYPTLNLDLIWFAGSGLFLLALGLANCAAGKTRSRPIRVSVVALNVVATMHATALAFLLGEAQAYVSVAICAALLIATTRALSKR